MPETLSMQSNIEGFNNYWVDTNGDVYNLDRPTAEPLCSWVVNTGYLQVKLFKNGKAYYRYVHRLVALAYVDNPNNYKYVMHLDGDKTNCDASNLAWGTNSQNTQDGYDSGAYKFKSRSHAVVAVNKETGKRYEFPSIRQLSENLGLNRKTVSAILKGEKTTNNYKYDLFYQMPND